MSQKYITNLIQNYDKFVSNDIILSINGIKVHEYTLRELLSKFQTGLDIILNLFKLFKNKSL